MRTKPAHAFLIGVAVLLMAEVANASTMLYIPRQFDLSEMGTVGVAFMNPMLTTASLTYRLRSDQGTTLMTANGTIPAKGQSALTLDQIFPGASEPL